MNSGLTCIGLEQPKYSSNVAATLRAAAVYDAKMVAFTGQRYKHSSQDTTKQFRHMPLINVKNLKDVIPKGCVPVAVDIIEGAIPLPEYIHPRSAFYIFGPEDGTLQPEITSWCKDIIYIPTSVCMNLAATVNVVLYDRMAKRI